MSSRLTTRTSHSIESPNILTTVRTGRPNGCNQCHLDKTLKWTADYLESWYGIPSPQLNIDEETYAASVLWMTKGNAAQRALMAWSLGWAEARRATTDDWMPLYLGLLMLDDYHAVRFIAARSLKSHAGFEHIAFNFR